MGTLGPLMMTEMAVGVDALLVVISGLRAPVYLANALALLDGTAPEVWETRPERRELEATGEWLHDTLRLPITRNQQRLLLLSGRSIADFFAEKLVLATTGLLAPAAWLVMQLILESPTAPTPLLLGPVLGVCGYFLVDPRLSWASRQVHRSTFEAVHTFFDLVTLERLADASTTQTVTQAVTISNAPLFRRMTASLERYRLEQTTPWRELHRIADEWDMPGLGDFADIMRLEERKAALTETLQIRVRELREGRLAKQRSQAQTDTETPIIWVTLPTLILGLTFTIPPLFILIDL